jgi:cytochrome c peroxidase
VLRRASDDAVPAWKFDGVVSVDVASVPMFRLTSADYKEQAVKELAHQRELSRTNRPQRDTARAFGPKPQQPKPPRP